MESRGVRKDKNTTTAIRIEVKVVRRDGIGFEGQVGLVKINVGLVSQNNGRGEWQKTFISDTH